ncbi:MAG: sugar transferase [Eubacteriales bacterium]|nr:sugar transferase [Eubacteriales bacterium]
MRKEVVHNGVKYYVEEKKFYNFIKRVFDLTVALVFLTLFFWLFLGIAIAIKIDDGGPVFYIQNRVGLFGKEFRFYKFRSMRTDADEMFESLQDQNDTSGEMFKMRNDPRVTRVGRFIRKTSLDELPQFFNIIKGDISFVGPRSPLPREVENYTDYSMQRLSVIGGLSCYWQISGRSEIDFSGMVELDYKYIRERGILTDLKILFLTIPAVIRGDGAY